MPRGPRSNPLALAVLALLFERPMHPYEVSQLLKERRKHESIKLNYGALYAVVESLQERGLVRSLETAREGRRPERTVYEITDAGRAELHSWMRDLVATPAREFTRFEAALALLPALPPDEVTTLLERRLERLGAEITLMRSENEAALDHGVDPLFLIEGEYRLALRQAERTWVTKLLEDIRRGAFEIVPAWRTWHAGGPHPYPSATSPSPSTRDEEVGPS